MLHHKRLMWHIDSAAFCASDMHYMLFTTKGVCAGGPRPGLHGGCVGDHKNSAASSTQQDMLDEAEQGLKQQQASFVAQLLQDASLQEVRLAMHCLCLACCPVLCFLFLCC